MTFKCDHCDSVFSNKSTLNRHLRNIHQLQFGNLDNKLCPICSKRGNKKHILNHFKSDHDISLNVSYKIFPDLNAFYEWKKEVEEETIASFVKVRQAQVLKDGSNVLYFHCHRDGVFTPSGSNKRNIKIQGSNKINAFCPAQMTVRVDGACVSVKFIETHIGHAKEFSRIKCYKKDKKDIELLTPSTTPSAVLCDTENTDTNESSKVDIALHCGLSNLDQGEFCNTIKFLNQSENVEAWVKKMKSDDYSFIRFYKPQGIPYDTLQKEDIILIFFNDIQLELLRIYGSGCICIDGTNGLNKRILQMFTLLVLDDMRQGVPCAFMVTNRTDATVFKFFFETVKNSLNSELKPDVFMSDVNNVIYNGWKAVMPPAEKYLYSWWYVDREWQKNLKKRVPVNKLSDIYQKLRILLEESSELDFRDKLGQIHSYLHSDPNTIQFAEYFETEYGSNVQAWAYCYRLFVGLNTNTNLEKMHSSMKYMYLKGKKSGRIDDGINNIILFAKNRIFDVLKFIEEEKVTSINTSIQKKHEVTLSMEKNISSVVKSGNDWLISYIDNTSHKVQKLQENCTCHIKCHSCLICIHSSSCSCFDNCVQWNVCSHMHYICLSFKGMDNTDFSANFGERYYFEIAMNDLEPVTALDGVSNKPEMEISSYKEQVKEKLLTVMELVNKCNSLDEIKTVMNLVDCIPSAMKSTKDLTEGNI